MPGDKHAKFRTEALALLTKWTGDLPADELLALMSQMLGQCLAMQDQRKHTKESAMRIITDNIEIGNHMILEQLKDTMGKA
jgi:hypothetical protein